MRYWLVVVLYILMISALPAEWVAISPDRSQELFTCDPADLATATVTFTLDGYELENIEQEGLRYSRISYRNEGRILEVGKPDLPCFTRLIAIPERGEVSFEILSRQEEVISDMLVYPQQELRSESEPYREVFEIDRDFYETGAIFPGRVVNLGMPAILRDLRVVALTINPFRYDPANRELTVVTDMEVKVTTGGSGGENQKTRSGARSRFFEPLYNSIVINYDALSSRDMEYQDPSYLFIIPNSTTIESYMQDLVLWKHQKGFQVTMVNTAVTGTSNTAIKNYIQNAYDNWDNPPEFLCLVGDASGTYTIPTWFESWSGYGGEGDQPYTQLEGNDVLADIYIGRMSISSPNDLLSIKDKILHYEKEPYMGNTSWYKKALLVGDPYYSGESCITTKLFIKEMIEDDYPYFSYLEAYSGNYVNQIASGINGGVSYFNYRGYLNMSGWGNSNITSLGNGYMLPYAVFLTCGTGDFYNDTSRSETFIRAGSPASPKGAIAAIGTATWGTHTVFNNCVDAGTYWGVFEDHIYNPGGSLVRGKLNLYLNFPTNPGNYVDIFSHWNTLMGDPGVELWTNTPSNMLVIHPDQIALGSNYLEVTVNRSFDIPLENAWVTVLMGDDDIFATAFTDNQGKVILPVAATIAGSTTLTITAHDYKPYIANLAVLQDDLFLNISQVDIDDDNSGTSSGNNDGSVNPGEDIELAVELTNYGTSFALGVSAELESLSDMVTVTDTQETYGNIPAGSSLYSADDFDISVAPDALGGLNATLEMTIYDNNREHWTDYIILNIAGPNLLYDDYEVDDGNNQILDPGETGDLVMTLENVGTTTAFDIYGTITSHFASINITDSIGYFGNIAPGATVNNNGNRFEVAIDNQVYPGTQISCRVELYNTSGYYSEQIFLITVGQVDVSDPLGPDEYGYYCYDDGDTYYVDVVPTYDWIEIDPDQPGHNFTGTQLPLSDGGNDGDIYTLTLPFSIRFYGRSYSQITVCSNGWIAPGTTEQYSFMNWHLPGPLGPSPMIAAFWDDLNTNEGHIYYYYNSMEHYIIVEWSEINNNYNSNYNETFEVILYDSNYYPTPTDDTEILIQYKDFNNIDQNTTEGPYCTIGLEDHTGTMGLEYSFRNQYPPTCRTLSDYSVILFTTRQSMIPEPPQAVFSDEELDVFLPSDQTESFIFEIANAGDAALTYYIQEDYQDSRTSGGPDSYDYNWLDSNEPDGPVFNWIDISGSGSPVTFPNNDNGTSLIPLGFNFVYYGNTYNQFRINPNGWIGFANDLNTWTNTQIPSSNAPRPALMPFWDDLYPQDVYGGSGTVYYHGNTDRMVVWFDDVIHYPGVNNGTYSFEVIIYASGYIKFQYYNLSGDVNSTTIGIQNSPGTDGLQVAYNTNYLQNNLAIIFRPPLDGWLDLSINGGTVASGDADLISLDIDTSGLAEGSYSCDLFIETNDPNTSQVTIPVNLTVSNQMLNPPANVRNFVVGNIMQLTWDAVPGATSYRVYSSLDPHAPFTSWQLEQAGILGLSWFTTISGYKKFFCVIAHN